MPDPGRPQLIRGVTVYFNLACNKGKSDFIWAGWCAYQGVGPRATVRNPPAGIVELPSNVEGAIEASAPEPACQKRLIGGPWLAAFSTNRLCRVRQRRPRPQPGEQQRRYAGQRLRRRGPPPSPLEEANRPVPPVGRVVSGMTGPFSSTVCLSARPPEGPGPGRSDPRAPISGSSILGRRDFR